MEGVEEWNKWRKQKPKIKPNLSEANLTKANLSKANLFEADLTGAHLTGAQLSGAHLSGAHLSGANLNGANLNDANLNGANLSEANLFGANLVGAHLFGANLSEANLSEANLLQANLFNAKLSEATLSEADLSKAYLTAANLSRANLSRAELAAAYLLGANLSGANLRGADLRSATLVNSTLQGTDLRGCSVYGASVWNARLDAATIQSNLLITDAGEPAIRVDNLEVAQFIYLLLNNAKIRDVVDTIGKKAVLILGRFTAERKEVLDKIREALRQLGFLPILFDFEKPSTKNTHETIVTLAGLSRFVIADITDPKSIPQELVSIVQTLPSVPVQPLLQIGYKPWGMYDHIKVYPWVLPLFEYQSHETLLSDLQQKVIAPAEEKAKELTRK